MNPKLGLFITYVIYLSVIVSLLILALYPYLSVAEAKPIVPLSQDFNYNYKLGDRVPEFVIDEIIARHATGTKAYGMKRTLYCESRFYNVQSNIINRHGQREDSWGIAQINLYWNPSVSKEQALDIEYAIKWMSDHWGTTRWYGWDSVSDSCNPVYI